MQLYEETLLEAAQCQHPTLKPEKLQAFVLWCLSETQTTEGQADFLGAIDQKLPADIQACYELLSQLEVNDLIGYTLINEFGLGFLEKHIIPALIRSIIAKLSFSRNDLSSSFP